MHSRLHAKLRRTLGPIFALVAVASLALMGLRPAKQALAQGNLFQFPTPTRPPFATPTRSCVFPGVPPCPTFTASATTAPTATKTERPGFETPVASPSRTTVPDLSPTASYTPSNSPIPSATSTPSITPTSSPTHTATPQLAIVPRFAAAVERLIPVQYVWLYLLVALTAFAAIGAGIWFIVTRRK